MLFISPPFGNYINLYLKTISIKGSYTLNPRPGLIYQNHQNFDDFLLKYNGWVNKIGLRNKGIDHAIKNYDQKGEEIISIAILEERRSRNNREKNP